MQQISRWGVLIIDIGIIIFSLALAHLLRFNFNIPTTEDYDNLLLGTPVMIVIRVFSFFIFKTYAGIILHTSIEDAQRIFWAVLSGSIFMATLGNLGFYKITGHFALPYSILIIDFLVSIFMLTAYRALVKILYIEFRSGKKDKKFVAIYGAGETGITTKTALERDMGNKFSVNAFFDDNSNFRKKRLLGVTIYPGKFLERYLLANQPQLLVISDNNISTDKKQEIFELCLKYNVKVRNVPPVEKWINGELSLQQIKEINIDDLLERDPIQLDWENIENQLKNKTILITGAAGSIGSEIARQVLRFHPKLLVLLDQAETPLYEIDIELSNTFSHLKHEVVIGDIRNYERMQHIFKSYRPDIVYHAAAYKHVPMMEANPSEAILTNISGTGITADLAKEFHVEKFVFVSTDKAVNPTNIMGASKRMAEIYVQSLNHFKENTNTNTKFITTRFGNVLGSNGSVIPLFKKQIASGGPVTVTHPEMTRYFMTIPEACQLVLEAGCMGKGGEIYVFDMGKSIKILDLAKSMIRLSGLELEKDIQITFTGLRPGEKLFEELLNPSETSLPTHHKKIMIATVREYNFEKIKSVVNKLTYLFDKQNNNELVKILKKYIPEYKSNNSIFEKLD
ncbi:MAG: nucleoside-diphosphate sugar epimerase/dehydratase [Saprospiraceae bacterium]|nr:nucleoside-diphosphate sugar epimerase/dehydratase [Saprospiraceae bacterium]MDG2418185.1 nucleoside-diphosphate sugar epimerase/dehydratase [Saprospiraceae bacterium]